MCSLTSYFTTTWLLYFGHRLDCFFERFKKLKNNMTTEDRNSEPVPSTSSATNPTIPGGQDFFGDDGPCDDRRLCAAEMVKMWNLAKVFKNLGTNEQCVAFAESNGMVRCNKICGKHRTPMRLTKSSNKSFGSWNCFKGHCKQRGQVSRTRGTFFENIKIELIHVFYLMYAFAHKWSYKTTMNEDPFKEERQQILSKSTICNWFCYCREAVVTYQLDKTQYIGKIGGPGKVVQIDEAKFGKRKYSKGRDIEGHLVLGMIEDGSEDLRLEVCPDVRSAEVLVPIIQKHIELGTTIRTHRKTYDCLGENGYIHEKVYSSDPLMNDPLKNEWGAVKRFFKKDNLNHSEDFGDVIMEHLWRRNIMKYKKDPFLEIVEVIKYVYKLK